MLFFPKACHSSRSQDSRSGHHWVHPLEWPVGLLLELAEKRVHVQFEAARLAGLHCIRFNYISRRRRIRRAQMGLFAKRRAEEEKFAPYAHQNNVGL
jgi:hypothetical protein